MIGDAHAFLVHDNSFIDLNLEGEDSKGAAIYIATTAQNVHVKGNTFERCQAVSGGALFWEYKAPLLSLNTFIDNSA